ncbi:MAG: putative toxin-antitoxin system toxin component, PIN family [Nitrospirota bacterium]
MDTGVLVSAFAFGGIPEKAVKKVFKEADIYVSPVLLEEYRDTPLKLVEQGKINHQQLKVLIAGIAAFVTNAKMVYPTEKVSVCRDPEDDILLECCIAAKAGLLITSDKDLLEIEELPFALEIVTPREFIEKY